MSLATDYNFENSLYKSGQDEQIKQNQERQENNKQSKSMGVYGNTTSITQNQTQYNKYYQQRIAQQEIVKQASKNQNAKNKYDLPTKIMKENIKDLIKLQSVQNSVKQLEQFEKSFNQFQDINENTFKSHGDGILFTEGETKGKQQSKNSNNDLKDKVAQNKLMKAQVNQDEEPISNDGKWKLYLQQAYKYHCKSTYATGIHPTFDRIQKSVSHMKVNTFMIFCRNFCIALPRIKIIEIFKKANHFQTVMAFSNFLDALLIISLEIYSQPASENYSFESLAFKKLIKLLRIDSGQSFHSKMLQIGLRSRQHGLNAHEILEKPKPQSSYKYKINAHNGRCPQQIKDELFIIKQNKEMLKYDAKQKRDIKLLEEKNKFQQMNKISFSLKKILHGGYISPRQKKNSQVILHFPNMQQKKKKQVRLKESYLNIEDSTKYKKNNLIKYRKYQIEPQQSQDEESRNESYLKKISQQKTKSKNIVGYLFSYKLKKYQNDKLKRKEHFQKLRLNTIIGQARYQSNYSKAQSQVRRVVTVGDESIQSRLSNQYGMTISKQIHGQSKSNFKKQFPMPSTSKDNHGHMQIINAAHKSQEPLEQIYFEELINNKQEDQYLSQHLKMDFKKFRYFQFQK